MARRLALPLALGALSGLGSAASRFVPFADVEELRPQRLHEFCGPETIQGPDGHGRLRRCSHRVRKRLDDGGDLELSWAMDVDPDRILSLDTEAEHGVRLTRCSPGELELELPASHLRHAADGHLIVGSRFVHGCSHLGDRHLFHRVLRVHSQSLEIAGIRLSRVRLGTEELTSLAHAVPSLSFFFSWMPVEALDESPFPEMRTDFGLNRRHLQRQRRRLGVFESFGDNLKDYVDDDAGGFQGHSKTKDSIDTSDGYLNLMPKQLSNFGWNWNFFMNTTEEPDFKVDVPGAKGVLKIRKPFIKVHAGLYLNFSSQFIGITLPPKVQWTWGLRGRGRVQARMLGSLNTTSDAGEDPFMAFKLPIFQEIETPRWFDKVEFATGSLPITMEPGFQCTATMYHRGQFHGAVGIGGRTHGELNPSLSYDSLKGFETTFLGNLTDTNIWPPLWIIFTKQFEMGVVLKPSLLMRGDFSGLERATMAIETRPYINITVSREAPTATSTDVSSMKPLIVYPLRVTGLDVLDFKKKYKVRISVNGAEAETSAQVNFGQVEYRDHISNFELGHIPDTALLSPSTKILISLVEVEDGLNQQPLINVIATGEVSCKALVAGECTPTPSNVPLVTVTGLTLAMAQVAILWTSDPEPWFASKIRGLAFTFPQVIVRQDSLTAAYAQKPDSFVVGQQAQGIAMHLVHGGQSYIIPLVGAVAEDQLALAGASTVEFGPGFVGTWAACASQTTCDDTRLELWAASTLIGSGIMPAVDIPHAGSSGFMADTKTGLESTVPSTVSIVGRGQLAQTVALVSLSTKVITTLGSSMFLSPRAETLVPLDGTQRLVWTVADVDRRKQYSFTVQPLALRQIPSGSTNAFPQFRQVNGRLLVPLVTKSTVSAVCDSMTLAGVPADQAPCTFSTDLTLKDASYGDGMIFVVQVSWSAGGLDHQLFSPPLLVGGTTAGAAAAPTPASHAAAAGGGLGRRLEDGARAAPRVLFDREAWNARIQQHGETCNKRDLTFNLGMGLKMRGRVEGITVPKGFPMLGGEDDQPGLTTGYRTIFEKQPGDSVMDALGGADSPLCQAGLCQGALPGCSGGGEKAMHYPSLVFDFNRPMFFGNGTKKGMFDGMLKQALAYAFSTMPEMVDVMIQEMQKKPSGASPPAAPATPAAPVATTAAPAHVTPSSWWSDGASSPRPAPEIDWPTQPLVPTPTPAPHPESLQDAFKSWWGGATSSRRLTDARGRPLTVAGDADELPRTLGTHQVRMDFPRGVPFVVDRPLVEMMLQNGYFVGLEDVDDGAVQSHGSLQITRFYVDSGLRGSSEKLSAEELHEAGAFVRAALLVAALAAVAAGLAVLTLARRRSLGPAGAAALLPLDDDAATGLE